MNLTWESNDEKMFACSPVRLFALIAVLLFAAAPAWADEITLNRGFGTRTTSGAPGGGIRASIYGNHCNGYVYKQPDHYLRVNEGMSLQLTVNSTVDSVLTIIGPGGIWCDDDGASGLDARISQYFPDGIYMVYVGKYSEGVDGNYTLSISQW